MRIPTQQQIKAWGQETADWYGDRDGNELVDETFDFIDQILNRDGYNPRLHIDKEGYLYTLVYLEAGYIKGWFNRDEQNAAHPND